MPLGRFQIAEIATNLNAPGFTLRAVKTVRKVEGQGGPYRDWIHVDLAVTAPPFSGIISWVVMPGELLAFKKQLEAMHERIHAGDSALLASVEPGVHLELTMDGTGHVRGSYRISDEHIDFESPRLAGKFTIDQTFLPGIIASLEDLLNTPSEVISA